MWFPYGPYVIANLATHPYKYQMQPSWITETIFTDDEVKAKKHLEPDT